MDWDSPTTKKHIAEAAAQGCELVGAGKNRIYRTYRLPCGHEREITIAHMRSGGFHCQSCLDDRLREEAEAQGCVLLGPGSKDGYRLYRFPCRHKNEIRIAHMRSGGFRCQTCIDDNLREEAEAQGCDLLGSGTTKAFRLYRLPCGHEKEVQPTGMRRGSFRCQTCLDNKLEKEARTNGCELLGPGKNKDHRTYRLPCGHELEAQVSQMRWGKVKCQLCFDKKLVQEAEAQGCVLLGPGSRDSYRTYRFPCGHEREVGIINIREGTFRCRACLDERLIAEAEAHGCILVGPGSHFQYRTYRLSCGHESEFRPSHIRDDNFRCQTCINDRILAEAKAQQCELLGPGKNPSYRTYRLPCGHVDQYRTEHIKTGTFRCSTCLNTRFKEEAKEQGCVLLGPGTTTRHRTYRLPCGHEKVATMGQMRKGQVFCQPCFDKKLKAEAEAQGCELVGPGSDSGYRVYRLECGHKQKIQPGNMRLGSFRCTDCLNNKLKAEAEAQRCEILGPGKDAHYRTYLLSCGHEQVVHIQAMRLGSFRCQTCEDYSFTQPSNAYLLHIKVGADEWLKLGYAKDVGFRTTRYGLPSEAEVFVLAALPFDTGKEAQEFETSLHKKHKRKRLRARDMLVFHTGSGATECYPIKMVETLVAEFKKVE